MKKSSAKKKARPSSKPRLFQVLFALVIGLSLHSCADIPHSSVAGIENKLDGFAKELNAALQKLGSPGSTEVSNRKNSNGDADSFSACLQFFTAGKPPVVSPKPTNRYLCYDAFAILYSGESKTPVFVAEKLNRVSIANADEKRTNRFFPEARLRAAERANLADYKGSGYDRGHMAPAGDMPTAEAMAQSFSLANMVPQAPEHNRGTWAKSVEGATRKYAARATGNVYVITGPVYEPNIAESEGIGPGLVRVPKYLFKLVYDVDTHRAWAHWHLNEDATKGSKPISYAELVERTGIDFLPSVKSID